MLHRLLAAAISHGSLVIPQTRNSIDRLAPQWRGGYTPNRKGGVPDFPGTGRWGLANESCGTVPWACQEGCSCSNGTEPCDVGQACFWFASGCTVGCAACDGNGRRNGDACRCGQCAAPVLNRPEWRTGNRGCTGACIGTDKDWTRYNPWRSPGRAPTFGPCGMAGGGPQPGVESGEYNATRFARQGDLGTALPRQHAAVWRAGQPAETAWFIRANHGGGYSFRLCPAGEELTEECFERTVLRFDTAGQTLRWDDGSEERINGTFVTEGTFPPGSMWAMNPLPGSPTADFPPPCKAGTEPPVRAPTARGKYGENPGPCAGNWPTTVTIVDRVLVPADIAPGEYVLGWRWDCELTAQVWSACSDITILPPGL